MEKKDNFTIAFKFSLLIVIGGFCGAMVMKACNNEFKPKHNIVDGSVVVK